MFLRAWCALVASLEPYLNVAVEIADVTGSRLDLVDSDWIFQRFDEENHFASWVFRSIKH